MSRKHKSTYLFIPLLAAFALGQNAFAAAPATAAAAAPATAPAAAPKSAPSAAPIAEKAAPAATAPATAATGKKTCDDIKSDIDAKLKAKGVKTYTLDIVPKADVKDAKVVGSCEAGSKKITYKRG